MITDDFRFLRDRTAYWLGIKCLQDRKILTITKPIKDEFFKTQEYFLRRIDTTKADEKTKKYLKVLGQITLGETI